MKRVLSTFVLFLALAITFSSQSGCGGSQPNVNGANTNVNANVNTNANIASASPANGTEYPPIASGLASADFELLDGGKVKLADKKGKVVLVTLWGTWCGPCVAEMPTLIKLQDAYRDKGFEVLGLNIGDGEGTPESIDKITKFVAEKQLNYTVARSSSDATREFYKVTKADVVPQALLIDREGRLRGAFVGGGPRISASIEDTVAKIMSE